MRKTGIDCRIIPGVPAYAAALGQELTIPEIAQSIVLTRVSMQSTGMPKGETPENFARTGVTLAIHPGVRNMREIERVLSPFYGAGCPVVVAYRVGWLDEILLRGTLFDIRKKCAPKRLPAPCSILRGPALACGANAGRDIGVQGKRAL